MERKMKISALLLVCLAAASFAAIRTGGQPTSSNPFHGNGTYTVVNTLIGGLTQSYGMTIQDDVSNSIWISNWGTTTNAEYSMSTGSPTGTSWLIEEIDADDQGYCEYSGGNQFLIGDWTFSNLGVFNVDGVLLRSIPGPTGAWETVTGICAGGNMMYISDFHADEVAWGGYTGSESTISWTTAPFDNVAGMAYWGGYIFMTCQTVGSDNTFIFATNSDGSINMTPVWSCEFVEEDMEGAGSIDYDGEYLYLYPQNTFVYILDIDWDPQALTPSTWANIKASF